MAIERPNWELPAEQQVIAIVLFGIVAALTFAYMVYVARKEGKRYPYFMFLGAALTVYYEPINNVLGLCTYPEINQFTWIEVFHRKIPVYIGFCYMFYFSATVLWVKRRIEAGITGKQWWRYYIVGVVLATSFELIPIHLGWWRYYGDHQALQILGFPMWWWFANPASVMGIAAVVYLLMKGNVITERSAVMLVPLYPIMELTVHGSIAAPVFAALQGTTDISVTTGASVATIIMSLVLMWVFGKVVTRPAAVVAASSQDVASPQLHMAR